MTEHVIREIRCDRCGRGQTYEAPSNERQYMKGGFRLHVYAEGDRSGKMVLSLPGEDRSPHGIKIDLCSECSEAFYEFIAHAGKP
jgi:hypothetical protein